MNPIAAGFGILLAIATFFSYTSETIDENLKNPSAAAIEANNVEWAALRNNRPCFGPKDPTCPYPLPNEK